MFLRLCLYSFGLTAQADQPMKSLRLQVLCDGSAQSTDEADVCSSLITHVNLIHLGNLQLSEFSLLCSFFDLSSGGLQWFATGFLFVESQLCRSSHTDVVS